MNKQEYRRLNLKNGWDLPGGEKPPLTGRRQELRRAYELLVQKTDDAYLREAAERKQREQRKKEQKAQESLREEISANYMFMPEEDRRAYLAQLQNPAYRTGGEVPPAAPVYSHEAKKKDAGAAQKSLWEAELRDTSDDRWKERRKKRLRITAAVIAAAVVITGGRLLFGPAVLTADISAYEDVAITVEGLTEEPFEITPGELAGMKKTSIKVPVHEEELGPEDVPERGRAVGPDLETFLAAYGVSLNDVRSMRAYSENDKSTAYAHSLEDSTIVLSVANGRVPLGEREAPLRIAVSDTDADEWSGWIRRIVFTMKQTE